MKEYPWPGQYKAAISFTMDNLGEAQDVNKGVWPADEPIGSHYSVKRQIPRMLDWLDKHSVKATYFAESWSLDVYPDIVEEMSRRGHEIAWHGYQHETWSGLSADEEELNFKRSFERASKHGVKYQGFRPPGGTINDRTYDLLRENGVSYVSPLGTLGIDRGLVILPFEWKTVDAHYYMEKFCNIRKSLGDTEEVMSPGDFRNYLFSKISNVVKAHSYISILFHPFLQTDEERFSVLIDVLERLSNDPDIWCAPCQEVATWVSEHAESFTSNNI